MILLFLAVWGRWRCQKKDKIDPLTFSLSTNLLVLDSSVDRIKRNLGNQSVGD